VLFWIVAMSVGLWLTWVLARRIVRPVDSLDRAAAEVARQNYDYRVPVNSRDELGRLASTFNSMCASLQQARQDLIRHERISTIGRRPSIVHDLRNPLAAIHCGAEMLVDTDLAPAQVKRLAETSIAPRAASRDAQSCDARAAPGSRTCKLRQ
jgi:HAMP domain-containing protein